MTSGYIQAPVIPSRRSESGPRCWIHVAICGTRQATWHDRDVCKSQEERSVSRYVVVSGYRGGRISSRPEYGVVQYLKETSGITDLDTDGYEEAESAWLYHEQWTRE